jgi:hypothetical protein
MKHLTAFLMVVLVPLLGTGSSFADGNHLTISSNTLTFPPTMIGTSSVQSYTFSWWNGEVNSGIRIDITLGGSDYSLFQYQLNTTTGGWNNWNPSNPVFSSYIYGAAGSLIVYVKFTPKNQSAGNVGVTWNDVHKLGPAPGYPDYGTINQINPYVDLVSSDNPLPIQLASFKAATLASNDVTLTWTTASETNNYGFYIQRNGVNLGFIAGHGTTLQSHSYSYTDNPGPGGYQYRLQQVDLDGTATLSESILMDVTAPVPSKFLLNQNYPNPFNPSTQIAFSVTKEGPVTLRVFDILGREAVTLVNENRKPGQYTKRFDGSRFASGVYMYVLSSSEGQLTRRMILSK